MIRFERGMVVEQLRSALNTLGAAIDSKHVDLSESDVSKGLFVLGQSPHDYGLLDLTDEQHLGLLYYWLVQVRTVNAAPHGRAAFFYKAEQELAQYKRDSASTLYTRGFHKLAILGLGSAAAYYVNALGEGYNHEHTLLVGEQDSWLPSGHQRSRGKGYINHEAHLIGQWGKTVPRFGTTYVDRKAFADANAEVLQRIERDGGERLEGAVTRVSRETDHWFRIEFSNGSRRWARKVVIATGAGPHANRGFEVAQAARSQVMDLDAFMRAHPSHCSQKGRSIIVHGPNAGIDAVERAGECGFSRIFWFMSQKSSPAFLSGNRLLHAPHVPPTKLIERTDFKPDTAPQSAIVKIDKHQDKIRVSFIIPGGAVRHEDVDLYVYALGQDGAAEGAVLNILDEAVRQKQLVPIYDIQGRHATAEEQRAHARAPRGAKPPIHENVIVGFQLVGTTFEAGIEVIGAAANMVANGDQREKMLRVRDTQPGTVLTADQLGTIKSAIGSQNAVMPRYVTRDVNFSTDDRTVLRTHIAAKYPNVSEEQAQRIIEAILASRRTTDDDMRQGYHPLGYDAWWQRHFRQMLEYWNTRPEQRASVARRHEVENRVPLKGRPGFHTT